jgi:hypothetical protein
VATLGRFVARRFTVEHRRHGAIDDDAICWYEGLQALRMLDEVAGWRIRGETNASHPYVLDGGRGLAHRNEFGEPPWNAARVLTRGKLQRLRFPYGRIRLTGAVYAPGAFSDVAIVGPVLEQLGRAVPAFGALGSSSSTGANRPTSPVRSPILRPRDAV